MRHIAQQKQQKSKGDVMSPLT